MSLKDYDSIMREYDNKRMEAHRQTQNRRRELYEALPEFQETQDALSSLYFEQSRRAINGELQADSSLLKKIDELKEKKRTLLLQNGYPEDYLEERYECADCKDTGFLPDRSKCHCLIKKIGDANYRQSGLNHLFETENFDHLSLDYYKGEDLARFQKTYAQAKKFIEEFANSYRNLFFYGKVGTGKSFLSCCIAKELLDQSYSILYFSSADLFDQIADLRFGQREKTELSLFNEQLDSCDLLILDDLGTECTNSFVSSELFSILNKRHSAKKATIISSNIEPGALRDHYSERIFSRIMSAFEILEFSGPDIRLQKKLQAKNN